MDFSLEPERQTLAEAARGFLSRSFTGDQERLAAMAFLGWFGMLVPESLGGAGGALQDAGVLAQEFGRGLCCNEVQSAWLASLMLLAAIGHSQGALDSQVSVEPEGPSGRVPAWVADTIGLLCSGNPVGVELSAGSLVVQESGDGLQAKGQSGSLLWPQEARSALATATTPDGSDLALVLIEVDSPAVDLCIRKCVDGSLMAVASVLQPVPVHATPMERADLNWALNGATLLWCAEMVGAAKAVLDMTVSYVKDRIQFGRPIGSFQAVQHQLANVRTLVDAAELATYQALAAWDLGQGVTAGEPMPPGALREVAIGASLSALREATLTAHQLHGGVGFVSEHPLHRYSDRSLLFSAILGGEESSYARLGHNGFVTAR